MKISIERSVLLKALGQAQSVVERRNTIPILANVLVEADGNTVSLALRQFLQSRSMRLCASCLTARWLP